MEVGDGVLHELRELASRRAALRLLVLFGSRARGDARPGSDWDFGYVSDAAFDTLALRSDLADILRTDQVDLVDLDRASALLRFRAARDGLPVFERREGFFRRLQYEAASFWCEAGPLIRRGYEEILENLAG